MRQSEQQHQKRAIGGIDVWMTLGAITTAIVMVLAATPANGQTFTVLHNFTGAGDGSQPESGVTLDQAGNIYGTTNGGSLDGYCGPHDCGGVFKLSRHGSGWLLNSLYTFQGGTDGSEPSTNLLIAPDGSLYGNTFFGGVPGCGFGGGCGIVFQLMPPPSACKAVVCPWIETVLHRFDDGDGGRHPSSPVVLDASGNVYGTTVNGGAGNPYGCVGFDGGCGVVYQLTKTQGAWTENILYSFTGGSDGGTPYGTVVLDHSGNIDGSANFGGNYVGVVYQVAPSGIETVLYTLQNQSQQGAYTRGLIADSAGNLYGSAQAQGSNGGGTVYELSPGNGTWNFALVYPISGGCCNPEGPADLVMDQAGSLYGTTFGEGAHGLGSVFRLTPSSGGWIYTDLHDFTGGADGKWPNSPLALDRSGNIYGTTPYGGTDGYGTVFEITP
jgi:uncharacterized repeat protein (TIGR03803 family)